MTLETVIRAHDRLVQTIERSEFASVLNVLVSGDEGEVNEVRALQLLADRGGDNVTSRAAGDPVRLLEPLAGAPGARAAAAAAASSTSATAAGTSSTRSSASGCGGPRRSPTGPLLEPVDDD